MVATMPIDEVRAVRGATALAHVEPEGSRRLLEAALECFSRFGYHATTTRQIAQQCGLSSGGVYVHYKSKTELLYAIALVGHQSSLAVVEDAARLHGGVGHLERVREIIRALALWHVDHQSLARVIAYEQGALPAELRQNLRPFRRRFFETIECELTAGQATGEIAHGDTAYMTRAVLSLCTDIARWYRPGRSPDAEELGDAYGEMAVRLVHGA
jgi:AcrR family transcriptional regulator